MQPSPESRVVYHPLPAGGEPIACRDAWTAALDDCDPDRADEAVAEVRGASAEVRSACAALTALAEVCRARWSLPNASLAKASARAATALGEVVPPTPLAHYAAGLVASWAVRTVDAEAHLRAAVERTGQPFACELLAHIYLDQRRVEDAAWALDAVPARWKPLRGVGWARARVAAASGQDAKAGVIAADLLAAGEGGPDATGLDIVLQEVAPARRLPFLRNLHAKTGSALVRGRLCDAEARAATPSFRVTEPIGARNLTRTLLGRLSKAGRGPSAAVVVLGLLFFLPVTLLRLVLFPWPLHRYLVAHRRAVEATGQSPVLRLPTHGGLVVALWAALVTSAGLAVTFHPAWLAISGVCALSLLLCFRTIEREIPLLD